MNIKPTTTHHMLFTDSPTMKAYYSKLHQRYVVPHPARSEFIIGSGLTVETAMRKARKYVQDHLI